jgi:hypothetical protein
LIKKASFKPEHFRTFWEHCSHVIGHKGRPSARPLLITLLVIVFPAGDTQSGKLCRAVFLAFMLAMDMETTHDSTDKNKNLR